MNKYLQDKTIAINEVSQKLHDRWIICHLWTDFNLDNATIAFDATEPERDLRAKERLSNTIDWAKPLPDDIDQLLTNAYNKVLSEGVEEFIALLMRVTGENRAEVEVGLAELFALAAKDNKNRVNGVAVTNTVANLT